MEFVEGIRWEPGATVPSLVDGFRALGFQSTKLAKASDVLYKMWSQEAKVVLTFTSNMVTSGLRELFAQLIELGLVGAVVTTAGSVEEDIMKAQGEKFPLSRFSADDIALHERGHNRVGNIVITNDSYGRFEGLMKGYLDDVIKEKPELTVVELLDRLGVKLEDGHSILHQAHEQGVPVFCPAITDGAVGFHLYLARDRHPGFKLDVIGDFKELLFSLSPDDTKGFIALGGGVSKHFGLLGTLINGGADLAVYMTTSTGWSGSMSGASTDEAKSWGKLKDDSDSVTVIGDVSINFPLAAFHALERLHSEGRL
jgi:deoxyhypusine synthase